MYKEFNYVDMFAFSIPLCKSKHTVGINLHYMSSFRNKYARFLKFQADNIPVPFKS